MNWTSLGVQLAQIGLPAIGTVLGGPLGGTLGGVLGRSIAAALGTEPTPEAISQAVTQNPDDARIRLAKIEADNQQAAEETKRLQAVLADVANARSQTVALAETKSPLAFGAGLMSLLSVIVFIAFTAALFFIKVEIPDKLYALLNAGYGADLIWVGQSFNYWLGATDGSKRNAETLRGMAANSNTPSPAHVAEKMAEAVKSAVAGR